MRHPRRTDPHDRLVHEPADKRRHEENRDLHPARHVRPVLEHEFHARQVIEYQRDEERD